MMRVNEFFYDLDSPQFIGQSSAQQLILDPKLYTENVVPKPKPADPPANKNKPISLRVSICCSSCVEIIEYEIKKIKGVKSVDSNFHKNKVTVTGDVSVADVLSAARKNFKDAELWD